MQTSSYKELLAQRETLEQKIKEARDREVSGAISKARELIAQYGLSQGDIFTAGRKQSGSRKGTVVAPKYRDPATGATWTGRGKPPRWIQGQDRALFEIPPA